MPHTWSMFKDGHRSIEHPAPQGYFDRATELAAQIKGDVTLDDERVVIKTGGAVVTITPAYIRIVSWSF